MLYLTPSDDKYKYSNRAGAEITLEAVCFVLKRMRMSLNGRNVSVFENREAPDVNTFVRRRQSRNRGNFACGIHLL
jgi:hypothetical protein